MAVELAGSVPPSGTEADLLQRLITEGMATNSGNGADPSRYRTLLEVLIKACVMPPVERTPTPASREQVDLTLTILSRQISARPEILHLVHDDGSTTPTVFYKWLLPRLLHAAAHFSEEDPALGIALTDTIGDVLKSMGRETSDEGEGKSMQGVKRLYKVLNTIVDWCIDTLHGHTSPLFGYSALKPHPSIALLAIATLSKHHWVGIPDSIFLAAITQISIVWNRIRVDVIENPRSMLNILTYSIGSGRCSDVVIEILMDLMKEALSAENQFNPSSTEAYDRCIAALEFSESRLARQLEWLVYEHLDSANLSNPASRRLIIFLLQRKTDLPNMIPSTTLQRLRDDAHKLGGSAAAIRDQLDVMLGNAQDSSKKRPRSNEEGSIAEGLIRARLPELRFLVLDDLPEAWQTWVKSHEINSTRGKEVLLDLPCAMAECQKHGLDPIKISASPLIQIWVMSYPQPSVDGMRTLCLILDHHQDYELATNSRLIHYKRMIQMVVAGLRSKQRMVRVLSGLFFAEGKHPDPDIGRSHQRDLLNELNPLLVTGDKSQPTIQATTIPIIGEIGILCEDEYLGDIVEMLLSQFDSSTSVRAIALSELVRLSRHRSRSPYNFLSPHFDRVIYFITRNLNKKPDIIAAIIDFVGFQRTNFFHVTLSHTIPALALDRDRHGLEAIASLVQRKSHELILDHCHLILAKAFMDEMNTKATLDFLLDFLRRQTLNNIAEISVPTLIKSCNVPLLFNLTLELGNENQQTAEKAKKALALLQNAVNPKVNTDLGTFLKPNLLGVISQLNDTLQDLQGKKTAQSKNRIIRSMGALIDVAGDSMAAFCPQIVASLQSTMGIVELRTETLLSLEILVVKLKYHDVGPFVGRTTAALVSSWQDFDNKQRLIATRIIAYLSDNVAHIAEYLDDIVAIEGIPELAKVTAKLFHYRRSWKIREKLERLIQQILSKNSATSLVALKETVNLLSTSPGDIQVLSTGDVFDPVITKLLQTLLQVTTRDGVVDDMRDLACEALGCIGAVDPDRLATLPEANSIIIMRNFSDDEEAAEFALHLIRDVLVDAFKATNDTKHQNHLAFIIQELLRFCGFDAQLLNQKRDVVGTKIRTRWQSLAKEQLEILTPLLESRFSLQELPYRTYPSPAYPAAPTYREWLQIWTSDLIGRVMSKKEKSSSSDRSKAIFGVMRGVLRNQDVNIAHHVLPHLVLHVLLSGSEVDRTEVCKEINEVLSDQVSTMTLNDKRSLSAQVVFDLMDHLSKWLRLARNEKAARSKDERGQQERQWFTTSINIIDKVISNIDSELTAQAAFQSKSFARSLRDFERRIVQLRRQDRRGDRDLQIYFEKLHHIYAEMDEPDGMEGVSVSVLSPSLQYRIREHETMGSWTSAQSCWEVSLQHAPNDLDSHIGLLNCLRNLGHYDTLRTHVQGIRSRHPEWSERLASFEAEAAWTVGDWKSVENIKVWDEPMTQVMFALHTEKDFADSLQKARSILGRSITSRDYSRSYDTILRLHLLREVELVHKLRVKHKEPSRGSNQQTLLQQNGENLKRHLEHRFNMLAPAFRHQEAVLSIRRTAFREVQLNPLKDGVGEAWLLSSKIARKAGYEQTAYNSTLQAQETGAPFAFVQQAKLLRARGGTLKALNELENAIRLYSQVNAIDLTGMEGDGAKIQANFAQDRKIAKAVLLEARWADETERFDHNEIINRFKRATKLDQSFESPWYHLGHHFDSLVPLNDPAQAAVFNFHTCSHYIMALRHGVKFIYRTMPRMLTIWLDLADTDLTTCKKYPSIRPQVDAITKLVEQSRKDLSPWQFFTAFPQIVSRIVHRDAGAASALRNIMVTVVKKHPQQALWPMVGLMLSRRSERRSAYTSVIAKSNDVNNSTQLSMDAQRLAGTLLRFADHKVDDKKGELKIATSFSYLREVLPSKMIMPRQDALTCVLPSSSQQLTSHNPFPGDLVEIKDIEDRVVVMPSLQKPKKIVFVGSDGKNYPFLCKPHDDLRKDARLMDLNAVINKLLNSGSESRRRRLYIRTYAVLPLNEECGLLEWVSHTNALKPILEKEYLKYGKRVYTNEIAKILDAAKASKDPHTQQIVAFRDKILPIYRPTVFQEWFLTTWPEPTAWLASRMAYVRTLAVMSMVGYVLGLGDRHGENILFDARSGDTVHVDLNCLFEKGMTFEIPERVPFRLTHNLVDAMGVTGVEGVFRKAAELSMGVLRVNRESLMSVLEAFVHDPLVEWSRSKSKEKEKDIRATADRNLGPIQRKLRGIISDNVASVPNQVEILIQQATSPNNLGLMYQGWAPWL